MIELFCIVTVVVDTQLYAFVKIHRPVCTPQRVKFATCKFLKKKQKKPGCGNDPTKIEAVTN